MSPLRQYLHDYLAVRRALGFKLNRAEKLLEQFVTYVEARGERHLCIATILAWVTLPANTHRNWLAKRISLVRGFCSSPPCDRFGERGATSRLVAMATMSRYAVPLLQRRTG
jgi:hypothetical protein